MTEKTRFGKAQPKKEKQLDFFSEEVPEVGSKKSKEGRLKERSAAFINAFYDMVGRRKEMAKARHEKLKKKFSELKVELKGAGKLVGIGALVDALLLPLAGVALVGIVIQQVLKKNKDFMSALTFKVFEK